MKNEAIRQLFGWNCSRGFLSRAARIACIWICLLAATNLLGCRVAVPRALSAPSEEAGGGGQPTVLGDLPKVRLLSNPGWVEVRASIIASANESPQAALDRARNEARRAAVEFVSGVRVRSNFLSFEQVRESDSVTMIQELISTSADAWVVEERILSSPREFLKGGAYRQSIHLHARLLDRSAAADPDFEVEVEVSPARILEGEEATIHIRSTRDARIYLLALYPGGGELVLPNENRPNTFVRAHRSLVFPSDADKLRGVRLIGTLPAGSSHSVESVLVLAMRGDRDHPELGELLGMDAAAEEAGLLVSKFLVPLIDLPPDDWTLSQTSYEVFSR